MADEIGGAGNAGLPKPGTGDSYRTLSGVRVLVRKNGIIVLPNGKSLPKGSRIRRGGTIDLAGTDDFLGFSSGVIVRNSPDPRTSNISSRTYRQKVEFDPSGRRRAGEGFGSRPYGNPATKPIVARPAAKPVAARPVVAPKPAAARPVAARPAAKPVAARPVAARPTAVPNRTTGGSVGRGGSAAPSTSGRTAAPPVGRTAAPVAAKPAIPTSGSAVDNKVRQMFGEVAGFLSDPELGPILRKAASQGWDTSRLFGALQQTKFWRTKGDDERKWIILNKLDNATAKRQVEQQMQGINDLSRQSGITMSSLQVHDLAVNALKFGWSGPEIREKAFAAATAKPGGLDTAVTQQYGYLAAFLDNPEVGKLLQQGAKEGWSQQRLEAELQKTNFWKTTTDSQRRYNAMQEQAPAEAQQAVSARNSELLTLAQQLGVQVKPERLLKIAEDSLRFGWNQSQIRSSVSAEFDYVGGESGLAGQSSRQIKELAGQYLVPISDQMLEKWTEQIVAGTADEEGFKSYLVEQAKSMFPGMSAALDKGVTVAQYADPYKQIAARELELNPETIDLNDPKFRKMLDQVDSKGNRVSMSLSESSEYLRRLPEWQQTRGANEKAATLTENILKTFGAIS